MADYQNRDMTQGALFINNRKKQTNHPDFRGELTLSKALLKELVEKVKEGKGSEVIAGCVEEEVQGWQRIPVHRRSDFH